MESQFDIARPVVDLLGRAEGAKDVFLRGSLSTGDFDQYSDIDIGVDVSGSDNACFAGTIVSLMQEQMDVVFHDWATSLLPESYVISFYLRGAPLFWYIDIECLAIPHVPTLTRDCVSNDPLAHLIKPWIIHAKYVLRGAVHSNLPAFGSRVLGPNYQPDTPPARVLRLTLERLTEQADGRFAEIIDRCWQVANASL